MAEMCFNHVFKRKDMHEMKGQNLNNDQ
jgi:hypothetical protein